MAYKFSETGKLNDEFRNVFGIGFKPFYDGLMSVASKCLCIDILKFDEWLHQQHGNYDDEGKCMDDIIREKYGEKGVELINKVTDMGDFKLTDGIVSLTGLTTVADRMVCKETVTYRPHGSCWDGEDVNATVYDLMTIACYDMMAVGTVLYGGDYTAAEMAGKIGCLRQYMWGDDYLIVKIETKTFCCTYHVGEVFVQMAEWEGVMNLPPKQCHRFAVEGKELPKGSKIEPYKRCHGYKPKTISLAAENARIAKKFEVLGAMAKSLTSEGMRKALSVLTAIVSIKKLHGYDMADMADRMLRRKLWRDYGRDDNCQPVCYTARDFEHGPEVWKQVDETYVTELIAYFRQVLADSPAPEWPKQGDVVQFKEREKMQKKYQGKFLCEGVVASLSPCGDRIEWRASLCVGKYKNEYFLPGQLEPAPDEPKTKPKKTAKKAATKSQPTEKAKPQAVTITEKQLEKDGVVEFVRKDCYGITYEMKAFRMGYALNGRVLTEDDRLVFHNEFSFDSFEQLKLAFERTAETMANDEHPIHKKHADAAKEMGELTLAERLRQALLKQMRQAA